MNLEQLTQQFRVDAGDLTEPYLWESEWIAGWFTEAVSEAAIRGRLLMEAQNHLANTDLDKPLARAIGEASPQLEEIEALAKSLLELYE